MGKDATEVSNQYSSNQVESWKDEQIANQNKQVSPFPYDQGMGEPKSDIAFKSDNALQSGLDSGLELRPPAGGFHGDKWQDVHDGGQFKSDRQDAPLMEDPNAGGFHGDKWKDSAFPSTHSDMHGMNQMGDTQGISSMGEMQGMNKLGGQLGDNQDWQVKNDTIKNEAREDKQAMLAELKSHAGAPGELIKPSEISDSHGMTTDTMPQSVNLHDGRSAVQFHDGRDAASQDMALKDRVVHGVHEGDPLSMGNLFHKEKDKAGKKDKKDKKDKKEKDKKDKKLKKMKDKDAIHSGFPKDEHLKSDKGLIPVEHLKKEDAAFSSEHISGPSDQISKEDQIFKDKHLHDAEHLKQLHENQGDAAMHSGHAQPRGHEIATIKIPGIEAKDFAAQEMVNHQAKAKKELNAELKEHAGHSDHITPSEILTHGTVPHEESGAKASTHLTMPTDSGITDSLTREQVVAKAEVNAEIRDHAGELGSAEQIKPSEISAGFQPSGSTGFQSGSADFQNSGSMGFQPSGFQSGSMGFQPSDSTGFQSGSMGFQPSESAGFRDSGSMGFRDSGSMGFQPSESTNFQPSESAGFQSSSMGHLPAERIAGLEGTTDPLMREHMQAKQELNAELLKDQAALGTDQLMPSDIHGNTGFKSENTFGVKDSFAHDSLGTSQNFGNKDLPHGSLTSDNFSMGAKDSFAQDSLGTNQNFGNKDLQGSLASDNFSLGTKDSFANDSLGTNQNFGNKDLAKSSLASDKFETGADSFAHGSLGTDQNFGNKDLAKSSLASDTFATGADSFAQDNLGTNQNFGNKDLASDKFSTKDSFAHDSLGTQQNFSETGINQSTLPLSGGLDANNDQIMKDHVQQKKELNAEIQDLKVHGDHIVPSEIGTVTTEETHQLSTKEKIMEKVNAAAQAVKETFTGH